MVKAKAISFRDAKIQARREMGREIRALGFEHREIGPHIINILYYSCEYEEIGTRYRLEVFVDGRASMGHSFG